MIILLDPEDQNVRIRHEETAQVPNRADDPRDLAHHRCEDRGARVHRWPGDRRLHRGDGQGHRRVAELGGGEPSPGLTQEATRRTYERSVAGRHST